MKVHPLILLLELLIASSPALSGAGCINRRILHQPLFPSSSSPPPPPPDSSGGYNPNEPFFPEVPNGQGSQNQTPAPPAPPSANGSEPIPAATQPTKPIKKVAIVVSVGVVTLGMLCALSFYVYRHKLKHPVEDGKRPAHSHGYVADEPAAPPSSFLYIGTVEHSNRRPTEDAYSPDGSPRRRFDPVKKSDRYRPSPDLQPLPPLSRAPASSPPRNSTAAAALYSSEEEGSHDLAFYTPHGSIASTDEGFSTPVSRQSSRNSVGGSIRSSKRSRLPASSHDVIKHAIIPSIKAPPENKIGHMPRRAKFGAPPPPPNLALLQSISNQSDYSPQPPPPPPPPPPLESVDPKARSTWTNFIPRPSESASSAPKASSREEKAESAREDDTEGSKPKLKPLHWDKVRATSDRATVWDQLKRSSFQLNEDRMESLFGSNSVNNEGTRRSVAPPADREQQYRILDPRKSQNIAILLRALNVTRDEVSQALLDGSPEALGAELLETLVKMAPTKEEEIKLKGYKGDNSKLGSAEKFLRAILDVPFAFKRVEAMLYRANFDGEVKYLSKSFGTLEEASRELRSSKLFLKLLEAVLTTGNRMNVGTNRGGAQSFKLDTLLKLVDIKGVDRKTTLLHFVVQEIIRSEGMGSATTASQTSSKAKEEEFRRQGLQVVSGLSREIPDVKLAAGMDSDVLHNYVSKLESGLGQVRTILQYESLDTRGRFSESIKAFVSKAEEEICRIKEDERRALAVVREVTEFFHGDAAREEAHPLRIFMIVKDFLSTLDHVCKDVGTMQDRPVMGAARSCHISSNAPLPVHSRYNVTQNDTSSEQSSSP